MTGSEALSGRIYQHERHHLILQRATSVGRVEVATLAEDLDVTTETIRRDLTSLERKGLLRRVHGGAIPVDRLPEEPPVAVREGRWAEAKHAIGTAALKLLPAGGTVLIDGGTTALALVRQLPADSQLTIITNSLPAATLLAGRPAIDLHLLGGRVRSRTQVGVGEWPTHALSGIVCDVAFLGTNGLTVPGGFTTPDMEEAATKRAMVAASRQVVVLADHSKIGNSYLARFASFEEVDTLITDSLLDDDTVEEITDLGVNVVQA